VETKALVGDRGSYRLTKDLPSVQVPATVQAVLAARIDRLPPEDKRLLQSASVIGENVPFTLLEAVVEMQEEELHSNLSRLQAVEFLYETGLFPDLEYAFKHGLTYQVAYNSLLVERRRTLHAKILEAIELLYADRLAEQVERLALHAFRGEVWAKAPAYLRQAGAKAVGRSANREAVVYFEQALGALGHLPENRETLEQAIAIRIDLGPALRTIKRTSDPEVEQTYTQARELCQRFGDTPQLFPVLWGLCRVYHSRGELHKSRAVGEQLLSLAHSIQDPALILEAHHTQWSTLFSLGELHAAKEHFERGRALYDPQQHRQHAFVYGGHDPGVCCGTHAAHALWLFGYPDQALQRIQEALSLGRDLSHPFSLAFALSWSALVHQFRGERDAVQEQTEAAMTLAKEQGFPRWETWGSILQGWVSVEKGYVEQGIGQIRQGMDRADGTIQQPSVAILAEAYGKAGKPEEGLSVAAEALARAHKTGLCFYAAELHRIKGELLLAQEGKSEKAKAKRFRRWKAVFKRPLRLPAARVQSRWSCEPS